MKNKNLIVHYYQSAKLNLEFQHKIKELIQQHIEYKIKFKNSFLALIFINSNSIKLFGLMPGGSDDAKATTNIANTDAGLELAMGDAGEDDEDYELGQEQVIQTILLLGNEIWRNFGQEEVIDDYAVFFQHQFYIECFQMAYPSYDFSDLVKATEEVDSPEQMAACIQALINLLSEEILDYDINHIRGDAIVNGDAEHCINLLQILQQISSASMMQDTSGEDSERLRSESQRGPSQRAGGKEPERRQSSPDKVPGSASSGPVESNGNAPKSRATTGEKGKDADPVNQDPRAPLFDAGIGNIEDLDGAEGNPAFLRSSSNKHQFLDNLDAEIGMNDDEDEEEQDMDEEDPADVHAGANNNNRNTNSKLGADKVGDVIGQELDIEFEAEIQDNLQNHQGRGSAGSAGSSEQQPTGTQPPQNQKQQIFDGEEDNDYDEDGIVDHNEVDIIDDDQEFLGQNGDSRQGSDGQLGDLERRQQQDLDNLKHQMQQNAENFIADYDDELDQDEDDEDGLGGMQDGSDQYDDQNQQLILDDQDLDMEGIHELATGKGAERRMQASGEDEDDDDDGEELDLDDIDPALLEAAGQLGLGREAFPVPGSELMQRRPDVAGEGHVEEGPAITDEEDDREEVQGLAEILNDVHGDAQHSDEGVGKQILRGGQNIEDDQHLEVEGDEDEDDLPDVEVREMSEKLKMLNDQRQDGIRDESDLAAQRALRQAREAVDDDGEDQEELGQEMYGDEDEPMIDTDNLDDKEKALLCRYLQAEYERDPDSLPMPREVVEEFLARNHELLEQLDDLEDDEDGQGQAELQHEGAADDIDDAGEESVNNGIDSNEIVVEAHADDDDQKLSEEEAQAEAQRQRHLMAMAVPPGQAAEEDDEEAVDDELGEDAELLDGEEDQQQFLNEEQLQQQRRMQVGEMNLEGNAQMMEDEEDLAGAVGYAPDGTNQYLVQQHPGAVEGETAGALAAYGEEDDALEDEEDEQNPQPQMFNPQYLDEIQEVEQDDGNGYLFQNINVLAQQHPGNLTEEQLQFLQQQQQQMNLEQMSVQQPGMQRKSTGKRKKLASAYVRKPPALVQGGAYQRGSAAGLVGRAPTSAVSKKSKKMKIGGNTISHDDDQQPHGGRQLVGLDIGYGGASRSAQRRPNSHKRPQTAKPRKTAGLGGRARLRQGNQYPAAPPPGGLKAAMTSSTPSNRLRSGKALGGPAGSVKNMIVPQQSQMFTSFGVPQGGSAGAMQGVSQRKAASNPKKRYQGLYGSVKGVPPPAKKKTRGANQASMSRLAARNAKKVQQFQGQAQAPSQLQPSVGSQQLQAAVQDQAQNLVEMPILSEEFLNQLNEEQLQALLEQQQQLMMLQQQNQAQAANPNLSGMQAAPEEASEQQQFQNQLVEEEQLYQPPPVPPAPQQQAAAQVGVRTRGRAKAYAQAAGPPTAARIPSAGRKATVPASAGGPRASSGSRSAHGSRKRTQKTRSSLNIASSGPLSVGPAAGLGPQGPGSSNSIFRSQKMAVQIYGNSADSMLNNLISQRKKSGKGGKKRSQPNQAGKALAHQLSQMQQSQETYDIQAQLLAQQAQYNKLLAQQQPGATAEQLAANQLAFGQIADGAQGNRHGMQSEAAEGVITEVSPEQEEGESQSQFNQLSQQQRQQLLLQMQQQQQMVGSGQSNIQPLQGQISSIADDLSTEQIIELLQNAADAQNSQNNDELDGEGNFDENGVPIASQSQGQQLPEEIQLQLHQVLQERMLQQQQQQFLLQQQQMLNPAVQKSGRAAPVAEAIAGMALNDRVQSYQNICNILTESVAKARRRHGHLVEKRGGVAATQSASSSPQRPMTNKRMGGLGARDSLEADQRIMKQKKQFENLLKQYRMDLKLQETKRQQDLRRAEKIAAREEKIQQMRQKKFEEGMITQQRSQIIKRNAQQARLCKKVFKLASDLEKDKLLEEKKIAKEREWQKVSQRQAMVHTIENYYKDKIDMLKDRIDQEKFERQVAQEAQKKAFSQIKKELGDQKRKEVERYIQLLQQEDEKFDEANLDAGRLEQEVVRLYKK